MGTLTQKFAREVGQQGHLASFSFKHFKVSRLVWWADRQTVLSG